MTKMSTWMSVSEWTVRGWEVKNRHRYILIYPHEGGRTNTVMIENCRNERQSCVNDGVNVFVNDILRGVTFGALSGEAQDQSTLISPLMSRETSTLSHIPQQSRNTHIRTQPTHSLAASPHSVFWNILVSFMQNIETHLGFVTLLCSQPRSGRVELLWYDAQEFSLILCSIAVRRADVYHLERKRRRCREKYRAERDRDKDTQWVSWGTSSTGDRKWRSHTTAKEGCFCSCMAGGRGRTQQ